MKKRRVIMLLAALCMLMGCSSKIKKVEESTVTVDKKGVVTQVLIEEFPAKEYDTKDLEKNITSLVKKYNGDDGKKVSVQSFEAKKDIAKVILRYDSDDDYRAFNQVDFFAGTVAEALSEGYQFAGDFVDAEGADTKGNFVAEKTKLKAVIIREPVQVLVSGKILYVSRNMEIVSEDTARMIIEGEISHLDVTTEAFGYVIYEED